MSSAQPPEDTFDPATPPNNQNKNVIIKQPLNPGTYLAITFISLAISIGLGALFILFIPQLIATGITQKAFFIILIPLGFSVSAFLFGAMKSYATYKQKEVNSVLELGGPIVGFLITILLGINSTPMEQQPFQFTVSLTDESGATTSTQGKLYLLLGQERKPSENSDGIIFNFKTIPFEFSQSIVNLEFDSRDWVFSNGKKRDTLRLTPGKMQEKGIRLTDRCNSIQGVVYIKDIPRANIKIAINNDVFTHSDSLGTYTLKIPIKYQNVEQHLIAYLPDGHAIPLPAVYPCQNNQLPIKL
jgi:hypothetical protein